jgi:hyperosmotically inducible periplasmic protein
LEDDTMNKRTLVTAVAVVTCGASFSAAAADSSTFKGAARDAWITGKLETAFVLNAHLNPFAIETDVDGGVVHLTGIVKTDIDRDLAGEVAKGVEGVASVKNDLVVDRGVKPQPSREGRRSFGAWVDDATTTAAVKSKLVANANTEGLKIDVDTKGDVVTLSGRVASDQERDLAAQIAKNTGDVKSVRNDLVVDPK